MHILDFFKKRPDGPADYWVALAHERFQPDDLLKQAQEAERAGFDGVVCSDHLAPWWTEATAPTSSGNAWVWLGAVAQATTRATIGPAVTAIVHRYNPVVVAQQIATLGLLAPGRVVLGVGSGEAMNEVPAGMDWPSTEEQLARTEEALTIITRLLAGETVDFDGRFFRAKRAVLYSRPERRVPVILSAFHEGAAELAGRLADGLWTLGDPQTAPKVIGAYKHACGQAGREIGTVVVQAVFSYAPADEQALEHAREWKGTMVDRHYTDAVVDPAEIYRNGEDEVQDATFTKQVICSSDPDTHVKRIKLIEKLGADVMCLMNVSGADPHAALRFYGDKVLPELRKG
ncbi:MAG TPA: TIGR03557 family F420-dependent LLM class oxidoreductase [Gaiellaceae bacterium]|nr:TIGR03557 family F420-dependent LLM class oxidoreductase [Gaiellaceae bacterium]